MHTAVSSGHMEQYVAGAVHFFCTGPAFLVQAVLSYFLQDRCVLCDPTCGTLSSATLPKLSTNGRRCSSE